MVRSFPAGHALPDDAAVSRFLKIDRWNWHWPEPRYNVAPTTRVPIGVKADDNLLELNSARWGLIPHWYKKEAPPSLTFGPDVQAIIADSRNDFDSCPVSTRVNNTRNDFPELLVPLKA